MTVCFYPKLLFLLPFVAAISGLVHLWYLPKQAKAASKRRSKRKLVTSQADLKKNMNNLQNFVGIYSDMHDLVHEKLNMMADFDDDTFRFIFEVLVGLAVLSSFALYFIPIRLAFVASGVVTFFAGTPVFQALIVMAFQERRQAYQLLRWLSDRMFLQSPVSADAQEIVTACFSPAGDGQTKKACAEVYETQRWWPGLGWSDRYLLKGIDVFPWTDPRGRLHSPLEVLELLEGSQSAFSFSGDWEDGDWEHGIWLPFGLFVRLPMPVTLTRRRLWKRLALLDD